MDLLKGHAGRRRLCIIGVILGVAYGTELGEGINLGNANHVVAAEPIAQPREASPVVRLSASTLERLNTIALTPADLRLTYRILPGRSTMAHLGTPSYSPGSWSKILS